MVTHSDDSLATRASLLEQLKDWRQQTAWRDFDHSYAPLLRNVARKAGLSECEADEVVQEVLIAVAKKIGEFEHAGRRGSFRSWLFQQARWRTADQFRKRRTGAAGIEEGDPKDPGGGTNRGLTVGSSSDATPHGFEKIWDDEWYGWVRHLALSRVKGHVSTRQFQLFDLHFLQGMSVREAAATAGSTMAAVYMASSRVRRLYEAELKTVAASDGVPPEAKEAN